MSRGRGSHDPYWDTGPPPLHLAGSPNKFDRPPYTPMYLPAQPAFYPPSHPSGNGRVYSRHSMPMIPQPYPLHCRM
jgi:hypothetical protein